MLDIALGEKDRSHAIDTKLISSISTMINDGIKNESPIKEDFVIDSEKDEDRQKMKKEILDELKKQLSPKGGNDVIMIPIDNAGDKDKNKEGDDPKNKDDKNKNGDKNKKGKEFPKS